MLRLLMVAGGAQTFIPSPGGTGVFALTASPNGGWTTPQTPKAVYYNGKTYFGWINGDTGHLFVASYDHATQTVSEPFLIDEMGNSPDDHNSPAILVRDSDKRIIVAFSLHDGPSMFIRISTNPEDVTSFGSAVNLDPSIGAADYTYPALIQLTGVTNDPIYLFYRDLNGSTGRLAYSVSTDSGATWSARTLLVSDSGRIGYWAIAGSASRIDVMTTDGHPYGDDGEPVAVGHMYLDGSAGTWHQSDGTEIVASKPFAVSAMTEVYDGSEGLSFVMDGLSGANPVFTHIVSDTETTISARYLRWDGSAWDTTEVYAADWHPVDRFYGSLAINRADPDELFAGVKTGTGTSEIYSYTTADSGATWSAGEAITSGSVNLNSSPIAVINGAATMPVMWLNGSLSSPTEIEWGIKGLRR